MKKSTTTWGRLVTAWGFRKNGDTYKVEMKFPNDATSIEEMWDKAVGQTTGKPTSEELGEALKLIHQEVDLQFEAERKVKVGASHVKKSKIGA